MITFSQRLWWFLQRNFSLVGEIKVLDLSLLLFWIIDEIDLTLATHWRIGASQLDIFMQEIDFWSCVELINTLIRFKWIILFLHLELVLSWE